VGKQNPKKGSHFEESLKRLETIVEALEQGTVTLEESLKMYEEGISLSKQCLEELSNAELRLKKLRKDIDGTLALSDEDQEP
jgi:exodeoxyribonuclease VII small subunit